MEHFTCSLCRKNFSSKKLLQGHVYQCDRTWNPIQFLSTYNNIIPSSFSSSSPPITPTSKSIDLLQCLSGTGWSVKGKRGRKSKIDTELVSLPETEGHIRECESLSLRMEHQLACPRWSVKGKRGRKSTLLDDECVFDLVMLAYRDAYEFVNINKLISDNKRQRKGNKKSKK